METAGYYSLLFIMYCPLCHPRPDPVIPDLIGDLNTPKDRFPDRDRSPVKLGMTYNDSLRGQRKNHYSPIFFGNFGQPEYAGWLTVSFDCKSFDMFAICLPKVSWQRFSYFHSHCPEFFESNVNRNG